MGNAIIIIPTYNEAENIALLAEKLKESVNGACEVLVMDDSPDDKTVLAAFGQRWRYVWRTHNGSEKGLSQAVLEGIRRAKAEKKEFVIVMDADLQHPPRTVAVMLYALHTGYDFVVASRYMPGAGIREWSFKRRLISSIANLLAMPLMKFKVHDMMSGFFGFRVENLPKLENIKPRGYKIGTELLVRGGWKNVIEIPYTFENRAKGESKLSKKHITEYLKQLVSLYLYKFRFIKFALVGMSGIAVNLAVLWFLSEAVGMHYISAATLAFTASATNNYIWNFKWTFSDKETGVFRGWTKYLIMAGVTWAAYLGAFAMLYELAGLWYIASAFIAILITFVMRYVIADEYIWKERLEKTA